MRQKEGRGRGKGAEGGEFESLSSRMSRSGRKRA